MVRQKLGQGIYLLIAFNGHFAFPTISSSAITYENLTSQMSIQKESRQSLGEVDAMSSEFSDKCVKS